MRSPRRRSVLERETVYSSTWRRRSGSSLKTVDRTTAGMEDLEQFVSSLTPREENEKIKLYQNTVAMACPVCDEPFDDLVVCKEPKTRLTQSEPLDLCTMVHDDRPLLFTHKG